MATTKAKKSTKKAVKKSPATARATTTPRMSAETKRQLANGKRRLSIQVKKNASFGAVVKELERRLVIDKGIIGPIGCAPCHSGLDFIHIGQEVINPG
jgi:hypothetical protein